MIQWRKYFEMYLSDRYRLKLGFTGRNGRGKRLFNLLWEKYEYKGNISGGLYLNIFHLEIKINFKNNRYNKQLKP